MNIRWSTLPALALVAAAALHCGGDDSEGTPIGGSSGSGGQAGSGGTISSGGSSGSLATSGSGGSAGIEDAGTGGTGDITDRAVTNDGNPCPGTPPTPGSTCSLNEICAYAGGVYCGCSPPIDGGRVWRCLGFDGGRDPDCPTTKPTSGTSCAAAGTGTLCFYPGMAGCRCNDRNEWACR